MHWTLFIANTKIKSRGLTAATLGRLMIGKTPFHKHRATAFMQKEQKTPFLPSTNTYPVANKDRSHGDSAAAATTTFVAV